MMVFEDLERRRAEVERHRENSSRQAEASARFSSKGQGSVEFAERVDFGLTFIHKPVVQYGAEVDMDALEDELGTDVHDNKAPPLPLSTGYVSSWDTDSRGFYVGAWCAARVWYPETMMDNITIVSGYSDDILELIRGNAFKPEIIHHFTFSTVGMKDVPLDVD